MARTTTSPTGARPRPNSSRAAFTLFELIIVMVLIAVMLGIAAPSLRGFARGRSEADAATSVLAMTRAARSYASTMGAVCHLNFDQATETYWLTVQQGGTFVEPTGEIGLHFPLPKGMTFRLEFPPGEQQRPYVQFMPDGRNEQVVIWLINADQQAYRVYCPSATDEFRIVKPWESLP